MSRHSDGRAGCGYDRYRRIEWRMRTWMAVRDMVTQSSAAAIVAIAAAGVQSLCSRLAGSVVRRTMRRRFAAALWRPRAACRGSLGSMGATSAGQTQRLRWEDSRVRAAAESWQDTKGPHRSPFALGQDPRCAGRGKGQDLVVANVVISC